MRLVGIGKRDWWRLENEIGGDWGMRLVEIEETRLVEIMRLTINHNQSLPISTNHKKLL